MADSNLLFDLWSGLDGCVVCRDQAYAIPAAPPPGRPFLAPREDALLFIGEAPPADGGFWKLQNGDSLRHRCRIGRATLTVTRQTHSSGSLVAVTSSFKR